MSDELPSPDAGAQAPPPPASTPPESASAPRTRALAITLAATLGLGAPAVWRATRLQGATEIALAAAGVLIYLGWLAWESRVSVAELHKEEANLDRSSMEVAAAAKVVLLLTALLGGGAPALWPGALGLALLLLGAALRIAAVATLGPHYSHRLRVPGEVIERGVYRWIRHPAYLGTLIAHAGIPLLFPSWAALLGWALAWLPAVLYRTLLEDRVLSADPAYAAYAARRKRWVPGVW